MMKRQVTIRAKAETLETLRVIARDERKSLAEVIREGLRWRVAQGPSALSDRRP